MSSNCTDDMSENSTFHLCNGKSKIQVNLIFTKKTTLRFLEKSSQILQAHQGSSRCLVATSVPDAPSPRCTHDRADLFPQRHAFDVLIPWAALECDEAISKCRRCHLGYDVEKNGTSLRAYLIEHLEMINDQHLMKNHIMIDKLQELADMALKQEAGAYRLLEDTVSSNSDEATTQKASASAPS